jgi:hypothetical protein
MIKEEEKLQEEADDEIKKLSDKSKEKHCCMKIAKAKPHTWTIFKVPLLLLYLIILAKSGEITVMCRGVSKNF